MLNLWQTYFRVAQTAWDANAVVAMRMMRLASGGAVAKREMQKMVIEKAFAIAQAQTVAAARLMTGGGVEAASKSAANVTGGKYAQTGANSRADYIHTSHTALAYRIHIAH